MLPHVSPVVRPLLATFICRAAFSPLPPVEEIPGAAGASVPSAWRAPNSRMAPLASMVREATWAMAASALVCGDLSGSHAVSDATGTVPGPSPSRSAIVVDQSRLHDGIAHGGVIAARQHVVVAQQVLSAAVVLDQRAEGPAAAVGDGVAARVEVVVVSAGTAQRHQGRQLALVPGRVAGYARGVEQDLGVGAGRGPGRSGDEVRDIGGRNISRSGVGDRAGRECLAGSLATGGSQRSLAPAHAGLRSGQRELNSGASAGERPAWQ